MILKRMFLLILPAVLILCGCIVRVEQIPTEVPTNTPAPTPTIEIVPTVKYAGDPVRQRRPKYMPGELVDYTAMDGDTLPALASRFNTTEQEIRAANPILPEHVTTLPQGLPMQIPIYYRSGWGSSYKILADAQFVNGPADKGFSARSYTDRQPGWFKYFNVWSDNRNLRGGEIIDNIAEQYSISPRLLLAILQYLTNALTDPGYRNDFNTASVLRMPGDRYKSLSGQLNQVAEFFNDHYYNYKAGNFSEYELQDGSLIRIDPWLNACSATLQAYFAAIFSAEDYYRAIGPDGFVRLYKEMYGDFPPVEEYPAHLPGSLEQIEMRLPFKDGEAWTYTGGPHTAWGSMHPYAAIDFAPPSNQHGCFVSRAEVIAPHSGTIVRTGTGQAMLDMDEDGDERTGWVMLLLHLKTESIPPVGTHVETGDFLGHPSCDGGTSSGTHVHLARKYNGEWIEAGGIIPLNMDNWITEAGPVKYEGRMRRFSSYVTASTVSEYFSRILAGPPIYPTAVPTPKPKK
ncbi:MAG: LysM peptidoglycan-binding domain-containing protein [Anaerolineaceae bacterium]|nr:LysM peptidoglycan-binding domain-containing protein [Anaerolineaceae bacterium]